MCTTTHLWNLVFMIGIVGRGPVTRFPPIDLIYYLSVIKINDNYYSIDSSTKIIIRSHPNHPIDRNNEKLPDTAPAASID